jgi:SAM-dependent methyltransferase
MEDGLAAHVANGGRPFQCVSATMCRLPIADASLDIVYLHAALHHALSANHEDFKWSSPGNMLDMPKEIRRVLKPDGVFFLLGEGIYPDDIAYDPRRYERACEKDVSLPYESWYTLSEYYSAFRTTVAWPNLFVYQESEFMIADAYDRAGFKFSVVTASDQLTHHNYNQVASVFRSRLSERKVIGKVLPGWITLR